MPEFLRSLFFHNASDMPGQGGKNAVFLKGMASAAETIAVFCGKRRQKFCFNGIIPERDGICRFAEDFPYSEFLCFFGDSVQVKLVPETFKCFFADRKRILAIGNVNERCRFFRILTRRQNKPSDCCRRQSKTGIRPP